MPLINREKKCALFIELKGHVSKFQMLEKKFGPLDGLKSNLLQKLLIGKALSKGESFHVPSKFENFAPIQTKFHAQIVANLFYAYTKFQSLSTPRL